MKAGEWYIPGHYQSNTFRHRSIWNGIGLRPFFQQGCLQKFIAYGNKSASAIIRCKPWVMSVSILNALFNLGMIQVVQKITQTGEYGYSFGNSHHVKKVLCDCGDRPSIYRVHVENLREYLNQKTSLRLLSDE